MNLNDFDAEKAIAMLPILPVMMHDAAKQDAILKTLLCECPRLLEQVLAGLSPAERAGVKTAIQGVVSKLVEKEQKKLAGAAKPVQDILTIETIAKMKGGALSTMIKKHK